MQCLRRVEVICLTEDALGANVLVEKSCPITDTAMASFLSLLMSLLLLSLVRYLAQVLRNWNYYAKLCVLLVRPLCSLFMCTSALCMCITNNSTRVPGNDTDPEKEPLRAVISDGYGSGKIDACFNR